MVREVMGKRETQKTLAAYVNSAADLATAVKDFVVHGGKTDELVLKLNAFTIAENAVKDLIDDLNTKVAKYNN
jgi:hypothetical protein